MLRQFKRGLDKSLEGLTALSMGILVLDVTWQVATRFLLKNPSSWTEELATYLMIWVGLLGSAVALRRGAHLGIDYFVGKLAPRNQLAIEIFVCLCVAGFAISVMLVGGFELVKETFELGQTAPATGINLGYVYLVVPLSGFFIAMYAIEMLINAIKRLQAGIDSPQNITETERTAS